MAIVQRTIAASPSAVFRALTTPETYPRWLVGCQDIRAVDADWPSVGSAFHHRVGLAGPITVADHTKVLGVEPDRTLDLEVRARPLGRGRATFTLEAGPHDAATTVTLREVPIGLLSPTEPLAAPLIRRRNEVSLARLAELVEAGSGTDDVVE